MTARVHWKQEERDQVLLAASAIYRNNNGEKGWRQCIIDGQYEVLSADRHRPEGSIKTTPKADLDAMFARGNELLAIRDEKERIDLEEAERLHQEAQKLHDQNHPPLPRSATADMLATLVNQTAEHAAILFEQALEQRLMGTLDKVFSRVHEQVKQRIGLLVPQKHRKPKVLIVGMLGKHEERIHNDFDEYFDITFVDTTKIAQLKEKSITKDYVIINTDFINHATQDAVRKHPGLQLVSGNNAVTERLLDLAVHLQQKELQQ